jgi:hypothetical protein
MKQDQSDEIGSQHLEGRGWYEGWYDGWYYGRYDGMTDGGS